MKTAIFIWSIPKVLGAPGGIDMFSKKRAEYICTILNEYFSDNEMQWKVILDDTWADIDVISKKGADLLLIAPGGKGRFFIHRRSLIQSKAQIYYLDSLEYYNRDISKIIQFIKDSDDTNMSRSGIYGI